MNDYYIGQKVKMYDEKNALNLYGDVVEVTDKSIKVKWRNLQLNDSDEPVEYFEFDKIKTEKPIP